jgi:hypothetical protein
MFFFSQVSSIPPESVIVDGTVSIASYRPKTEMDYGTLLCWGDNELGRQAIPCVFHIIPAGKEHFKLDPLKCWVFLILVNFDIRKRFQNYLLPKTFVNL